MSTLTNNHCYEVFLAYHARARTAGPSSFLSGICVTSAMVVWAVVGAVVGLALGILVGATTDIPFAPEAGLLIGALAGWLAARR